MCFFSQIPFCLFLSDFLEHREEGFILMGHRAKQVYFLVGNKKTEASFALFFELEAWGSRILTFLSPYLTLNLFYLLLSLG